MFRFSDSSRTAWLGRLAWIRTAWLSALNFTDVSALTTIHFSILLCLCLLVDKNFKMDKILYEEIVLVPVAKADFEEFNNLAEQYLLSRHPHRQDDIKEDRAYIFGLAQNMLRKVRKEQEKDILRIHQDQKKDKKLTNRDGDEVIMIIMKEY
jgi:hypothetical protein